MNRLYDGGTGVPGYSGAAKKTAACAATTLSFAIAAVHGAVGVFDYRATAMHMDACVHVGAVVVGNAVMIVSQAVRRRTAARERQCGRGYNDANCIERDQAYRTVKAQSGNKPAQHAAFTSGSDSDFKRHSVSSKPGMRRNKGFDAFAAHSRHERLEAFAAGGASAMLLMPP